MLFIICIIELKKIVVLKMSCVVIELHLSYISYTIHASHCNKGNHFLNYFIYHIK